MVLENLRVMSKSFGNLKVLHYIVSMSRLLGNMPILVHDLDIL